MNLKQLKYIVEVFRNNLNVSFTAQKLYTSQPGISKQILSLEKELKTKIFYRNGKHLKKITPAGKKIIDNITDILSKIDDIKKIATEYNNEKKGCLNIATIQTQRRYIQIEVIKKFIRKFPEVSLKIHSIPNINAIQDILEKNYDFVIFSTDQKGNNSNNLVLPCFHWKLSIITPKNHPLSHMDNFNIQVLSSYKLLTYTKSCSGRTSIDKAFSAAGISPQIIFTSMDTDTIKSYVRMGLGVGIIAYLEYDHVLDADLAITDATHLFSLSTTLLAANRSAFFRSYMYSFIELIAPHLTKDQLVKIIETSKHKIQNYTTLINNISIY